MSRSLISALVAGLALAVISASAQQAPEASTSPSMASGREEVVVDVVVRDKHGKPVNDLPESSFSVLDNGQSRPIRSFRIVEGHDALNAEGSRAALNPMRQIRLVTLIFDRMDPSGRRLSREAALDLIRGELPPNVYMAVFSLGEKLNAIQAFTNKHDLLEKAIETATNGNAIEFANFSRTIEQQLETLVGNNQTGKQDFEERIAAMPVGSGPYGETDGWGAADQAMAQIMLNTIRFNERSEMDQTGRASIYGLLDAIREQYLLPGRKTVLYFAPGLLLPQSAEQAFKTIISTANLYNVSFYTIDSRGLSIENTNKEATSKLASSLAASSGALASGSGSQFNHDSDITTETAQSVDTALDSGHYNTQDTLGILATETGGFLTANTNDFRGAMQKISQDIETYYELTYSPEIQKYDGSFRKITVKLDRSDLRIQSRAGYFALPPSMTRSAALDPYEVPLLHALDTSPLPQAFPFEAGGLHFRGDGRDQTMGLLLDLPLKDVTVAKEPSTGAYAGGLSYLVLIKDDEGKVVKKLHGDVPVNLREDQLLSFQQSRFTDTEYFDVPPGRYTMEAAVLDRQSGKTSTHKSVVVVPRATPTLSLSSIALIRSWKPKEADAPADDPFVYGDKAVTPTLTPVVSKSGSTSLPFYVDIYPDASNTEKPKVVIEFTRDAKTQRVGAIPPGAPDAEGRIQYVATAPIEQFEPGNYEVRLIVQQGKEIAQESIGLNLEP